MATRKPPAAQPTPRPRDAAVTRDAILRSALEAFSRAGYDGVGVREIAQAAGVTGVLVNRYFGSKEALFAEAVELAFADDSLFTGDLATLSRRVAEHLVQKTRVEPAPGDAMLLLLRSAANPRAAEILRAGIERRFESPLASRLRGPHRSERAALFLAALAGFQLMRQLIAAPALAGGDTKRLAKRLAALFELLLRA